MYRVGRHADYCYSEPGSITTYQKILDIVDPGAPVLLLVVQGPDVKVLFPSGLVAWMEYDMLESWED